MAPGAALPLRIDPASATAPSEQLHHQLADLIADGTLVEGDRLPTVRALAGELGVAAGTVAKVYRQLETAGLVTTASRAGTVVAPSALSEQVALDRAAAAYAERARTAGLTEADALARVRAALRRLQD